MSNQKSHIAMYKTHNITVIKTCKMTNLHFRLEITKKTVDISSNLWYDIVKEESKVRYYLRFRRDQIEIYK